MTATTPIDALTAAREFIADPQRWCQHVSVIGTDGREHLARWPSPAKCCAYGALVHVSDNCDPPGWRELRDACGCSPIFFNDSHKHADVIAAFDRAIASLSSTVLGGEK